MKVLVAIDSMKGSLSSIEANGIVAEVFQAQGHEVTEVAIADGGEGTVEALVKNNAGELVEATVHALNNQKITAAYGWFEKEKMAVIETAAASGIQFLDGSLATHPGKTSSYGTGELILAAVNQGAKKIIIGLGGTGTVDGGVGLLSALGVEFYDENGDLLAVSGEILQRIDHISTECLAAELKAVEFWLASDVDNVLTGSSGAVQLFGKQKGLKETELATYDEAMKHFQKVVVGDEESRAGDGAAGGIGFAVRTFLGGKTYSGIQLIAEFSQLAEQMQAVDLVITGEGKLDAQSLHGKVPIGIGRLAQKYQLPVIAFVGSCLGADAVFEAEGISVVVPIVNQIMTLEEALAHAQQNVYQAAQRSLKLIELGANLLVAKKY